MPTDSRVPRVTLFTRADCHLCHAVEYVISRVAADIELRMERVDIDGPDQEQWKQLYTNDIPVVHIDGIEHARHHVDERELREAVRRAVPPEGKKQTDNA